MKNNKVGKETHIRVKEAAILMDFLISKMGGMSRNSIKSLLSHRQVMINGRITTLYNAELKVDDLVTISNNRGNVELTHPKLKIIYEDPDIIIADKKTGILTENINKIEETTVFTILKQYVKRSSPQNRVYIVHRLDREISGLLIFAKSREIQLYMQDNWHLDIKQRKYVALVEGQVSALAKPQNVDFQEIKNYKILKSNENFSLIEIELKAGEKNQIREYMYECGHPIVGDKRFNKRMSVIGRMGLHAQSISFAHPVTNERLSFQSAVPQKFLSVFL